MDALHVGTVASRSFCTSRTSRSPGAPSSRMCPESLVISHALRRIQQRDDYGQDRIDPESSPICRMTSAATMAGHRAQQVVTTCKGATDTDGEFWASPPCCG